jgi:hypothetical protein
VNEPPTDPQPAPSLPQRQKPRERAQIAPRAAIGTLLAALLAALAVPDSRAGIGLALAALAIALVGASNNPARSRWSTACLVLAGVLTLAPLWREAPWLVVVDLILALILTAAALAPGSSWRGLMKGPRTLLRRLPSGPGAAIRGAAVAVPAPGLGVMPSVVRGAALGGGLVLVFGALFASADQAFAELLSSVTAGAPGLDSLPARLGTGTLSLALGGALVLAAGTSTDPMPGVTGSGPRWRLAPIEWGVALGALAILFAAFVTVQFVVLFGGQTHVLETAGLTYADYAHQGFTQLLVVAALVLGVVALAKRWAVADGPRARSALRWLLAGLCVLTMVIVVSALHRLDLYVDVFGATRLRLWAALACAAIGALLVLVLASLALDRDAWVPRATLIGAGLVALALTAANPDGMIAERNVHRLANTGRFDERYASTLSADATPALAKLPPDIAARVLASQAHRLNSSDGPLGFNVSRSRARNLIAELR